MHAQRRPPSHSSVLSYFWVATSARLPVLTGRPSLPAIHPPLSPHQTPSAVEQLTSLSQSSDTLLKIGLRTKGCAGMAYHLEYVAKPGRFDEVVEQDGVKVIIDSRALMGVLGSEMDWKEDRLRCVPTPLFSKAWIGGQTHR